jgi:hypothetical protein
MWVQHDQLLISTLIASLFAELLSLIIDYTISHAIWTALASTLASPFATRIMSMHSTLIDVRNLIKGIITFLQCGKT